MLDTVGRYRTAMAEFAAMKHLDVWYSRLDIESVLQEFARSSSRSWSTSREAAREGSHQGQHDRVLEADRGRQREGADRRSVATDRADRELAPAASARSLRTAPTGAARLPGDARVRPPGAARGVRVDDFARKVVGVGSVGTRAWIALLLGRDGQDPLFLQVKEAEASVLEEFLARASSKTTASGSSSGNG